MIDRYSVKMWAEVSFVLFTMHAFDGQTDGRTDSQIFYRKSVHMHSQSHGRNHCSSSNFYLT